MIHSMTGFGAASGEVSLPGGATAQWRWELKSVNGRGLDVRFRTPAGFDGMEPTWRRAAAGLGRGNINANLSVDITSPSGPFVVDDEALSAALQIVDRLKKQVRNGTVSIDGLMTLRGVLVAPDSALTDADDTALATALTEGFAAAVAALDGARRAEGEAMASALAEQLATIAELTSKAADGAADAVRHHRDALKDQLSALLVDTELADDRLAAEVALLATKSDIREELDRLEGHLAAAQEKLRTGGTVGRALDFLAQEFMREANTLTVKSPTLDMKQIGLSLKGVIDQFKEQVQNIA